MSKRELRSAGSTAAQTLDSTKNYKYNSSGSLVESTGTPAGTDIVFSGSKSSLRRISDLERNVSILAAKTLTDDSSGSGYNSSNDYSDKAGRWATARTITLGGDLSGSVSIDGSAGVTLSATIAANSVALGTDTTGNYMAYATAGTGISISHTPGEASNATISSTITQYTDAGARGAVSFTAGSGAYNSTTGVFTIPTNNNQLTNGAGYITGITSGNVTTALGFTPYNSTNPSGYYSSGSTPSFGATSTGALTVTGGITATGEITAYYSDSRLKTNVAKIDGALGKVMAINGYTYDSSELAMSLGLPRHMDQIGLMADEVEAVLPELVTQSAIEGYKTIRYDKVVSVLVNAVKEQQAMIEELQALVKKTLH